MRDRTSGVITWRAAPSATSYIVALLVAAAALPSSDASAQTAPPRTRDLDSLTWRAAGAGVEMAVVDGNPQSTGDYTIAMRFKAGAFIAPHWHPAETRLMVIRGEIRVGFADVLDTLSARVVGP